MPDPTPLKIDCSHDAMLPVAELSMKRNPMNPKRHPPEQLDLFEKIVRHQGIRRPIVVSTRSGLIVSGHGLLETLERIGVAEAPVDYQDFATEADELAHMLADNMLAGYGVVSEAQCGVIVEEISRAGLDRELAGIIEEMKEAEEEARPAAMYELQPEFDEAYDGVLIFCRNGQEFAQLATVLDLPKTMNRRGEIGTTRVIHAKRFFDLCKSKS